MMTEGQKRRDKTAKLKERAIKTEEARGIEEILDPEVLEAIQALREETELLDFSPSPALLSFTKSDHKRLLIRAANRIGKTKSACYKLSRYLIDHPGSCCRIVAPDFKQGVEVSSAYMYSFLKPWLVDPGAYSAIRGFRHSTIELINGSTCQIRTGQQDISSHAGASLDVVLMDEPPREDIFFENVARTMDCNGSVWVVMTPIGPSLSWFRKIIEAPDSPWKEWVIKMSADNCPWYSKGQVKSWIAEARLDPLTFEQRINAGWEGAVVDRRFNGFTEKNLFAIDSLPASDWTVGIGIDWGELAGHNVALLALKSKTLIYIIDEYINAQGTTAEQDAIEIGRMLERNNLSWFNVDFITGDINSAGKAAKGSVNKLLSDAIGDLIGQAGTYYPANLKIHKPNKTAGSVAYGERLINNALHKAELFISDRCKVTKECLSSYNGEERFKHAIDGLRYLTVPWIEGMRKENPIGKIGVY